MCYAKAATPKPGVACSYASLRARPGTKIQKVPAALKHNITVWHRPDLITCCPSALVTQRA